MLSYFCPIPECNFKCPSKGIYHSDQKLKIGTFKSYFYSEKSLKKEKDKKVYQELSPEPMNLSYLIMFHMSLEHNEDQLKQMGYSMTYVRQMIEQINEIFKVDCINIKATIKSRAKILKYNFGIDV